MNSATFIGNLTADAQQKQVNNNKPFTTFDIAVNFKKGEVKQVTYISCIMNGDTSKLLPYLKKGTMVCVQGRVSCHVYTDRNNHAHAQMDLSVKQLWLLGGQNKTQPAAQAKQAINDTFVPPTALQQDDNDLPF